MDSLIFSLDPAFPGGVTTMARAMETAHRRLGLTPHLAYARLGGTRRLNPALLAETVHGKPRISTGYWPSIEFLNYLLPAVRFRRLLSRFPIVQVVSGVHSAGLVPIVAGRPFASWIATPFLDEIVGRHGGDNVTPSVRLNYTLRGVNQRLERWTFSRPRRVFALSQYTSRRLQELSGVDPARMSILRCPIDLDLFSPRGDAWRERPGRYLISAGRVDDPRKNMGSLVRSFAAIAPRHPDLHLVIVGRFQREDNEVTRLVGSLGLTGRVHFPGHREPAALAEMYRGADAFVMTSRQEGLGIVVMEAQSSGIPVVVMSCGGSDELIDDGDRDGWLLPQGDEAALSRVLDELAGAPELRARVGAAGRRKAEREFSFDRFTDQIRGAYHDVFPEAAAQLS
jgi:glycosyltransferase involved in cell wall biosynthesis